MFRQFGPVSVDWPHKSEPNCSKTRNGFAFLKYEVIFLLYLKADM